MTDPESKDAAVPSAAALDEPPVEPSWKPLLWLVGGLAVVVGLGEVLFDLLLDILELIGEGIFFVVEGSEEHLEDKIEEWFDLDPFHAEIVTAWSLTPVKILLAILALKWLWRKAHSKLIPRIVARLKRQQLAVRLAWRLLAWPYKALLAVAVLGALALVI